MTRVFFVFHTEDSELETEVHMTKLSATCPISPVSIAFFISIIIVIVIIIFPNM
jgi:hypothetical protein